MKIKEFIRKITSLISSKTCRFGDPKCLSNQRFGCICGKGGSSEPARVDPVAEAQSNLAARQATDPGAAALEWGIQSQYIPQLNELYQGVRESNLPGGQALSGQLMGALSEQLMSPTAMTASQQAATNAIRDREVARAQEAIRTRQNLGGNLYGGRSAAAEARDVGNITQQYEATDYNRLLAQQQAVQQAAQSMLAMYLGQQIPQFNYQGTVVDPNQQFAGGVSQRGQDIQQQMQEQANRTALYQSLFQAAGQGLGAAAGGAFGAGGMFAPPVPEK